MLSYIKAHKRIIIDFAYSFIAYALPTIMLQFVIQPLIAGRTTADENGLFVTLFNVVKLMVSIFIMPLANLRLLKKQECEKDIRINSFFNFLFVIAISATILIGTGLNGFYRNFSFNIGDIMRLLIILILMGIHDYYMISFRLVLNYKKIVIDNVLIVIGYGLGMLLFVRTGLWEFIFITGYLFGTFYVLLNTTLWKSIPNTGHGKGIARQYGELSASSMLSMTSIYCDRLIIYPILGGFDVSVYNSAAVVSKAISVISAPLRNVLLSYIVNNNGIVISKKKIKKLLPISIIAFAFVFGVFWIFSYFACELLYPKYAAAAMPFIPVITFAVMIQMVGAIMNIALLRFAETKVQTIISAIKLGVYLIAVFVLAVVAHTGLWGFCIAILLADITYVLAVITGLRKNISFTD